MNTGIRHGLLGVVMGFSLLSEISTTAADHFIGVNDSGFSPASLQIEAGDTVTWVNNDDFFPHTTTSDLAFSNPNYWNGILVDVGDTFSRTFETVGTFSYHDQSGSGTGTITVNTPSVIPNITLNDARLLDGKFLFEASGLTAGKSNVLMTSTNLTSWTAIQTNVASGSSMTFTNTANLSRSFFQVVEYP